MDLSDSTVEHLRRVAAAPDLSASRYTLEHEIGRGGMGVVYAAYDRDLRRRVALKVLDAVPQGEAQLMATLEHPAVVPIYESGELPDGRVFYAMKLVSGARLDQYLDDSVTLNERLRVIRRIAEAVAFAHTRGILHRDLKPQNVMVGEFGEVYVMDWGVEGIAGTPAFRAPDARLDERSDVYSLGALLRFALPVNSPAALQAIATKAMDQDAATRYTSGTGFLADLERYEEGLAVNAWAEPLWHRLYRFGSRNAVLLWLLAAYAAVKFLFFFLRQP